MDDARRLTAITQLLRLPDDIRHSTARDMSAVLRVLRLRIGVTDRDEVLFQLLQLKRELVRLVPADDSPTDAVNRGEEKEELQEEDHEASEHHPRQLEEDRDTDVEDHRHESEQPIHPSPSTDPSPTTGSRPSRSASIRGRLNDRDQRGNGVSDMEFNYVQLLLGDRRQATPSAISTLSSAGRKLYHQLLRGSSRSQPPQVAVSTARSSSSSNHPHQSVLDRIPVISYPSSNHQVHHLRTDRGHSSSAALVPSASGDSSSSDDEDYSYDADATELGTAGLLVPPAVVKYLVRIGVEPSLADDSIADQSAQIVYPASYSAFWTSHKDTIKDMRLFYEGHVLSMLLDNITDVELVTELAARRWFSLWLVANGRDWSEAQAFLPLSSTPGLTAKQLHLVRKYGKSHSVVRSGAAGRAKKTFAKPSISKSGSSSSSTSKKGRKSGSKKQEKRGAGARDKSDSETSGTAQG
jgi:hypothetical protein